MHRRPTGDKVVPIAKSDDKRQITAVLAASIAGEYLSPQLLFQGKTTRCHPSVTFPEGWDIVSVQIPPNCTDKLQPMDISINKSYKFLWKRSRHYTVIIICSSDT